MYLQYVHILCILTIRKLYFRAIQIPCKELGSVQHFTELNIKTVIMLIHNITDNCHSSIQYEHTWTHHLWHISHDILNLSCEIRSPNVYLTQVF